jgi:ribonuclease BN (tRNA processing enzyme)
MTAATDLMSVRPASAIGGALPWQHTRHRTRLALLGTSGGPPPMTGRSGICSALIVGDSTYLVDFGHGSYGQIGRLGVSPASIKNLFVTHLHSDHIADLYQLVWLRYGGGIGSLPGPFEVYGPGRAGGLPPAHAGGNAATVNPENPTPGTVDFIEKSIEASAYDLNIRIRDQGRPPIDGVLRAHDIVLPDVGASATGNLWPDMEPFPVFANSDVEVTATLVQHPPVFPSFAFRFDTADGSVVFSGDTSVSENLIRLARGADYLVHEVIALDWVAGLNVPESLLNHLAESHTDIDKVGGVAEASGVKHLVLNHLVPGDVSAVTDGQWRRRAQRGFSGKVTVGRDLMQLGVGSRM